MPIGVLSRWQLSWPEEPCCTTPVTGQQVTVSLLRPAHRTAESRSWPQLSSRGKPARSTLPSATPPGCKVFTRPRRLHRGAGLQCEDQCAVLLNANCAKHFYGCQVNFFLLWRLHRTQHAAMLVREESVEHNNPGCNLFSGSHTFLSCTPQ